MDKLKLKLLAAEIIFFIILGLLIFVPSWSIFYWQGWIYPFIITISILIMTLYFVKHDLTFMEKRIKIGITIEKTSQKIIKSFFFLLIGLIILSSIDHQYNLSNAPNILIYISYIMILISFFIFYQIQKINTFASATIEVEKEQKVISTGLYSIVQHPMYSGAFILFLFSPIVLDSFLGIIISVLIIITLIFRTLDEKKYLHKYLSGYSDYCKKTKYRLIPYV